MSNNRKDETADSGQAVIVAPLAPTTGPDGATVGASDPDRVIGRMDLGAGIAADVTQRDASRAVSNALRRNLGAMVSAQRLAAAIADGLLAIGEVPEGKRLDVMIEARRRGDLPLPGNDS